MNNSTQDILLFLILITLINSNDIDLTNNNSAIYLILAMVLFGSNGSSCGCNNNCNNGCGSNNRLFNF